MGENRGSQSVSENIWLEQGQIQSGQAVERAYRHIAKGLYIFTPAKAPATNGWLTDCSYLPGDCEHRQ